MNNEVSVNIQDLFLGITNPTLFEERYGIVRPDLHRIRFDFPSMKWIFRPIVMPGFEDLLAAGMFKPS